MKRILLGGIGILIVGLLVASFYFLETYGAPAINYNRDVEAFPLLRRILERITGEQAFYQSPTDMGVNRAGYAISDDAVCREAARQEVIREISGEADQHLLKASACARLICGATSSIP